MIILYMLGIMVVFLYSFWLRVVRNRCQLTGLSNKSSPISIAMQELAAAAGGIYLAIIALVSFLKVEMPEKIIFMSTTFDPIAMSAFGLAMVQPIILDVYNKLMGR